MLNEVKKQSGRSWAGLLISGIAATGLASEGTVQAAFTFGPAPVTAAASSQFDLTGTYSPAKLFDGTITPASIGTTSNQGGQYASSGTGDGTFANNDFNPVVSLTFAAPVSANSIVYAQRTGVGGAGADKVDKIHLWFTNTPFVPTLGTGNPAANTTPSGTPDEVINISYRTDNVLTAYAFPDGRTLSSQYVTIQFIGDPGRNPGSNPGGSEFRFALDTSVPEPTTLALIGLAGVGLLSRRRRD